MILSLSSLPVEIIYRILDHLTDKHLFLSMNNVSQRLNLILNSYQPYQVSQDRVKNGLSYFLL